MDCKDFEQQMGSNLSKKLVDINTKEKELVEKLKLVCNKNGKETNPTKSADILHQLGRVYHKRGKQDGDKMVCWIQSAALFNAALIRTKNVSKIKQDLQHLCSDILLAADAKTKHADLIEQSVLVKEKIKTMRAYTSAKLKVIPQIPSDELSKERVKHLEQQKTTLVGNLQSDITKQYTQLMEEVASYCYDIMGDAPCNFAIIGMGSLARKEITPFSDFEHVIALANEVLEKHGEAEWQNILKYFQWFSVIFQIILINLQETILPSVAIPSLNDFYSETQENNWFFDDITPSGISFDGMMPHACKFPLGRRKPTKTKKFQTELIKPVKQMLEYLKSEERLKNGYHLDDILTRTCFVHGDRAVYNEFNAGVTEILSTQNDNEKIESVKNQIVEDIENFATRSSVFQMNLKNEINIKKVAYRSITLFVAAYGRIFDIYESSCFDIVEKLSGKHGFSNYAKNKLMYAVAMACEIRLRWYMKHQRQTDIIKSSLNNPNGTKHFSSIIGKTSILQYFRIAYALQCDISNRLHLKRLHFHSNPQLLNLGLQLCFDKSDKNLPILYEISNLSKSARLRNFDDCLNSLEEDAKTNQTTTSQNNNISTHPSFSRIADVLYSAKCYDDAAEYYKISLPATSETKHSNVDSNFSYSLFKLGQCLLNMNRATEALEYYNRALKIYEQATLDADIDTSLAATLLGIGGCLLNMNRATEALEYYNRALKIKEQATLDADIDTSLATTLHGIGRCLLNMNRATEALEYYNRALKIKEQATLDADIDTSLATTLHRIGQCLLNMNRATEALEHYNRALKIKEQATLDADIDTSLAATLHEIGGCLLNMNRATEALEYYNRALKIYEQATLDADIDTSLATTLHGIGGCLLNMNRATEALEYYNRALIIKEQATLNADIDTSLATTLHRIGRCLLNMNRATEALEYYNRALKIKEQATLDADIDTSLATTLHEIGRCLLNMNRATEALEYYNRALIIKEQATLNADINTSLATTLHEIGRCLLNMNRATEALEYYNRALIIKEQATLDADIDTSLATTLHEIGRCLLNMNRATEALEYYNRALIIKEQATLDADIDTSLATTLHEIGRCLLNMNRATEALEYYNRALKIYEQATLDADIDTSLATTLHEIGGCLLNMNRATEALEYYNRALIIKEQATLDADIDTSLATTLHEIGRCLLNMNRATEALEYYNRVLKIYEQATLDADIDTSLAATLHEIGRCLLNMNRATEALEYYNRALIIKEQATLDANIDTSLATTLHRIGRCFFEHEPSNRSIGILQQNAKNQRTSNTECRH